MYRIHSSLLKFSLLIFVMAGFLLNSVSGSEWKEIKPFRGAPINVLFRTVSQKILAGSMSGELFSSEDGGKTWKFLNNFSSQNFSGSITHICSTPSGVLFVNTTVERGLFRSTDDGITWSPCKPISSPAEPVFSMECDKNNNIYAGRQDGLYISKDKGETWTKIISPEVKDYFRIIIFQNNSMYVIGDKFYISTDNGQTWSSKNLPTSATIQSLVLFNENEMMIMASYPVHLPFVIPGIFHSTDVGTTWTQIADGSALNGQSKLKQYKGRLYLTSYLGRIYSSSDKGASWDLITSNLTGTNISDIIFSENSFVASAYGGGILLSGTNNSAWALSCEGLPKIRNRALARWDDGKLIIANNAGIYLFDKQTDEYQSLNFSNGTISEIVDFHVMSDKSIIAANYSGGILKSADNGHTWRQITTPWEVSGLKVFEKGLKDDIYIYGGNPAGLYNYSNSNGKWRFISSDFPYAGSFSLDGSTSYLSSHLGIYTSVDSCKTWNLLFNFIDPIKAVKVLRPGYVVVFTMSEGIKYSSDSGKNWIMNDKYPLYGISYNDAAAITDSRILLASNKGLLESSDSGNSWNYVKAFENINVSRIIKTDSGDSIYILTDNGIFENTGSALLVNDNPVITEFSLEQNYPNPFNPNTAITYSIPFRSQVELKVYDLLGHEISTLVSKEQNAGKYNVQLDASSLPSGVYIYTIQVGSYRDSKKLVLLK